jgi:hypothetical protein
MLQELIVIRKRIDTVVVVIKGTATFLCSVGNWEVVEAILKAFSVAFRIVQHLRNWLDRLSMVSYMGSRIGYLYES